MKKWLFFILFAVFINNANAAVLVETQNGQKVVKASIPIAIADAASIGKNWELISSETISADTTIPDTVALSIKKGAMLTIATGKVLTINAPTTAASVQWISGAGRVAFGQSSVKEVYPEWWGAKPDGTTDCTPSINLALQSGCTNIKFGLGKYRLNTCIDVTNKGVKPIIFSGVGAPYGGQPATFEGTTILGYTNTWMVDCTGSSFVEMKDILFLGITSKAGLLFARTDASPYVLYSRLQRVYVYIPTNPTFTSVGSIALFGDKTENQVVEQCWFEADTAYVTTLYNDLSIASVYATITNDPRYVTNTDVSHRQNVYKGITGAAMLLIGQASSTYDQCFWQKATTDNTYAHAIVLQSSTGHGYEHCQRLNFTGQIEDYSYGIYAETRTINVKTALTNAGVTSALFRLGTGSYHYGLDLNTQTYSSTANILVLGVVSGTAYLYGGNIVVSDQGKLSDANVEYHGTRIQMAAVDSHDNLKWSYKPGSTFEMISNTDPLYGNNAFYVGTIASAASITGTIALTGARVGDAVMVAAGEDTLGCTLTGYVSAADTVTLVLANNGASPAVFGHYVTFRAKTVGLF